MVVPHCAHLCSFSAGADVDGLAAASRVAPGELTLSAAFACDVKSFDTCVAADDLLEVVRKPSAVVTARVDASAVPHAVGDASKMC
jgi:hypothetical protein